MPAARGRGDADGYQVVRRWKASVVAGFHTRDYVFRGDPAQASGVHNFDRLLLAPCSDRLGSLGSDRDGADR